MVLQRHFISIAFFFLYHDSCCYFFASVQLLLQWTCIEMERDREMDSDWWLSVSLMDCDERADWTTKPCHSLSGCRAAKNCEIINWITKAESPRQELDNCKIHNWLSQPDCHCTAGGCPYTATGCLLYCPCLCLRTFAKLVDREGELIYFRHVWLTAVNLANQNK